MNSPVPTTTITPAPKGFIEVAVGKKEKQLIAVVAIAMVKPASREGCYIYLNVASGDSARTSPVSIHTLEGYDVVKRLISEALAS